jgi:hypothetical protein
MTDKQTQAAAPGSNMEKDPSDWVTGDEPMTGAQRSYLTTLAQQAGVEVDDGLTKAQASIRIEELQHQTGRGTPASSGTTGGHEDSAGDPRGPKRSAASETSAAGEEDPGASDGDPAMQRAMQGEERSVSKKPRDDAQNATTQEETALANVREGYDRAL